VKAKKAYLLLGSNLGDRRFYLSEAKTALSAQGTILESSKIYLTKPWGASKQPDHFNQLIILQTTTPAPQLMQFILEVEASLGRERGHQWGARTIDIDILFYNFEIFDSDFLKVPHAHLHERNFALIPMMELAPDLEHPLMGKTIEELYFGCPDSLEVLMLEQNG